jgi:MFS family permease
MSIKNIPYSYRWTMLAVSTMLVVLHTFVFESIPPVMNQLARDLGLSFTQLGSLMGAYTLPGAVLSVSAGILTARFGSRKAGFFGLTLILLGTVLAALSSGFGQLLAGRVVGSIGAAFVFIIAPMAVTNWFAGREIGLAMGIYNMAVPLGTILAFNGLGAVAGQYGWRVSIWLTSLAVLLVLVVNQALFREAPQGAPGEQNTQKGITFRQFLKEAQWSVWLLCLTIVLYSASILQVFTIGPSYFSEVYGNSVNPDLLSSLPMIVSLILGPLAGRLIDVTGKKHWMIYGGSLGSALLLFLVPSGINPMSAMLLLGIFIAVLLPSIFAFPADILQPGHDGIVFGLIGACFGLGIFLGSLMVGVIRDLSGGFDATFYSMSFICLLMGLPIYLIMRSLGDHNN